MDRRFFHLARRVDARSHDLLDGRHGRHADDASARTSAPIPKAFPRAISFCSGARTRSRRIRISGRSCSRRASAARAIIAIDPLRTRTAAQCDEWIAIRPGTDAALALGMMHVLFAERLEDDDYLERYTLGVDELRARAARVHAGARRARSPAFPRERSSRSAREYGRAKAAFIRVNYGLQRHAGGGMAVRTIACLPALTGHWRRAGGGVQLSSSANFQFNSASSSAPICRRRCARST